MSDKKIYFGDFCAVIKDDGPDGEKDSHIEKILENVDLTGTDNKSDTDYKGRGSEAVFVSKNDKPKKLSRVNKILISLLVIIPLIQWILVMVLPAKIFFIVYAIGFALVAFISYLCAQYVMVGVEACLASVLVIMCLFGIPHGLRMSDLSNKTIMRIMYVNDNTMEKIEMGGTDEEIINELSGKFVYYYRYGCKDCLSTEAYIKSVVEDNGYEIIPIETRSKFGKRMMELYPVEEVPSGLAINPDGTFTKAVLYMAKDGKAIPSEEGLRKILDALEGQDG